MSQYAWDELVSYIARGKLTHAYALYRLLETTIEDTVYAKKLKADILWATNNSAACNAYVEVIEMCEEQGRLDEALSLVSMLMKLAPDNQDYHLLHAKLRRKHKSLS